MLCKLETPQGMEYSDGLQPGSQFLAERECLEYANKIGSDDGLFPLNPKVRLQAHIHLTNFEFGLNF